MSKDEKKAKAPAFQMYASDFLTDTQEMTVCEVGAYIRLLLNQWVNGSLPPEPMRLSFIAGMDTNEFIEAWKVISLKFQPNEEGRLCNSRLEIVRGRQQAFIKAKSEGGSKGMKNRYATGDEAIPLVDSEKVIKTVRANTNKVRKLNYLFDSPDFIIAWEAWIIHKKKHNKMYKTEDTENAQIKKLFKRCEGNTEYAVKCIYYSIDEGWEGVYPSKELEKQYGQKQSDNSQGKGGTSYNASAISELNRTIKKPD